MFPALFSRAWTGVLDSRSSLIHYFSLDTTAWINLFLLEPRNLTSTPMQLS